MPAASGYYAKLEAFTPMGRRLFEKELIYEGEFLTIAPGFTSEQFAENEPGARQAITVTGSMLDKWAENGNKMIEAGVKIPLPIGHVTDPESSRGQVVSFAVRTNAEGKKSLRGVIEFRDEEAAKLAATSDVSIYAEHKVNRGGVDYEWAITHVALTDYPVVTKLEPFQVLAASMVPSKGKNMEPLDAALKAFGLEAPSGASESDKKELLGKKLGFSLPKKEENEEKGEKGEKGEKKEEAPPKMEFSLPKVQLSMLVDARKTKLKTLCEIERKITPAVRKELEGRYCTDEAVTIACSMDNGDDFEMVCKALSLNAPVLGAEKTGKQAMSLDNPVADDNFLVALAKDRAAKAKG